MDKTSKKVTKDPKRVDAARKGREKYMSKLKERILNDAKKVAEILPMQAMKLPALLSMQAMKLSALLAMQAMKLPALPPLPPALTTVPSPQDQMTLISMALVYLLSLLSVFVYFLHITLPRPKIKNKSIKNRINHQNYIICCRKNIYNK